MQRDDRKSAVLLRVATTALFTIFLAAGATAQEPGEPGSEPERDLPRYTVELIVFTYADGATTGGEIFVPEPLPKPYSAPGEERPPVFGDLPSGPLSAPANDAPPAAGSGSDAAAAGSNAGRLPGEPENSEISGFDRDLADIPLRARIELTRLPPEQYRMNEIYEKLVALDAYQDRKSVV